MKSRRLISRLVVLTSILLITGCSVSKEIKFPAENEDIEQAISKYNLSWTVEEERLEDAELSTSGQGKVFAINMDNKQLGELTTIKKDDIKFISLILYGKPEDDNQDDEKHFAEYEKEDWENIFLLISDLYGETKYASEAYRDMMDFLLTKNKMMMSRRIYYSVMTMRISTIMCGLGKKAKMKHTPLMMM